MSQTASHAYSNLFCRHPWLLAWPCATHRGLSAARPPMLRVCSRAVCATRSPRAYSCSPHTRDDPGARAITVTTTNGTPAGLSGVSVSDIYNIAVGRGLKFELLTSEQVNAANIAYRQNEESDNKDIAYAELHPPIRRRWSQRETPSDHKNAR